LGAEAADNELADTIDIGLVHLQEGQAVQAVASLLNLVDVERHQDRVMVRWVPLVQSGETRRRICGCEDVQSLRVQD